MIEGEKKHLWQNVYNNIDTGCTSCSGYVGKYFDVKKRAVLRNFLRDFGHLYALFLFVNHTKNNRCEICAFVLKFMRVFSI